MHCRVYKAWSSKIYDNSTNDGMEERKIYFCKVVIHQPMKRFTVEYCKFMTTTKRESERERAC